MKKILIVCGGPGSGKSTHAAMIAKTTDYCLLEMSTILQEWLVNNETICLDDHCWSSKEQKALKDSGNLCDWYLTCAIIKEEIKENINRGVVISGFPRTREQAEVFGEFLLDEGLHESVIIVEMDLDKETRKQRVLEVRKVQENRVDDNQETFNHREEIYQKEKDCLAGNLVLNQAKRIVIVPNGTIQETSQKIYDALKI